MSDNTTHDCRDRFCEQHPVVADLLEADYDPRPDHDWVADDLDDGFDDGEDFAWFEVDDDLAADMTFDAWLE